MGAVIRLAAGLAIGVGVGVLATRFLTNENDDAAGLVDGVGAEKVSTKDKIAGRLREANEASRIARSEREAELRELFRRRTGDPSALVAPRDAAQP